MKKYLRKLSDRFILMLFRVTRTNPLMFAYKKMGILNAANEFESGEYYFVNKVLKSLLSPGSVLVDVGANVGHYSEMLHENFPEATIYSFEPNPTTFSILSEKLSGIAKVVAVPAGLGKEKSTLKIYSYKTSNTSQHASIYKEVFTDLHKDLDLIEFDVQIDTLDEFCAANNIPNIDFLKIDTEGNEYDTLCGAKQLLAENRIRIIQFEFNEMNIISRVFLKDFYGILGNYNIYRLMQNKLCPIFSYDSINEIFKFQNIVAIRKDIGITVA